MWTAAIFVACGSAARAQEKHGSHDEGKGHAAAKYEGEMHDPVTHKPVTKTWDLSKSEDKAELEKALSEGHIHELKSAAPPDPLSLFSLTTDLGVWTIVVFLLLLFVLSRLAWPKMLQGLQKREDRIRGALDEAQKAKDEAHAIRVSLQKQLDDAHDQVRQIIDEGRRDAQALRESELVKTKAEIQSERDRLHREIEMETDQALQRIWSQAAELATQVSAQALGRHLDGDSHRRLIDEALADLRAASGGANGHA